MSKRKRNIQVDYSGTFALKKDLRKVEVIDYGYQYMVLFHYVYIGTRDEILDLDNYKSVSVMNIEEVCVSNKGMVKSIFKALGLKTIDSYYRIYEESKSGIKLIMPSITDMSIDKFLKQN